MLAIGISTPQKIVVPKQRKYFLVILLAIFPLLIDPLSDFTSVFMLGYIYINKYKNALVKSENGSIREVKGILLIIDHCNQ